MTLLAELADLLGARRLVVFDTEFTSLGRTPPTEWNRDGFQREAVQIGGVSLDEDLAEVSSFSVLIRPQLNPVLSDYFVSLTGITDNRIAEEGVELSEALYRFSEFCGDAERICAFGCDADIIRANCREVKVEFPFDEDRLVNLRRPLCVMAGIAADAVDSSTLPAHFGLPRAGLRHDGLSDARSVAAVLREVRRRLGVATQNAAGARSNVEGSRYD